MTHKMNRLFLFPLPSPRKQPKQNKQTETNLNKNKPSNQNKTKTTRNHEQNSKDCSLSSDSVDTVPQTLFQHNENSDYFHRSCGFEPAPTQPRDICSEAIETLGVNSGRVKDEQFSASRWIRVMLFSLIEVVFLIVG